LWISDTLHRASSATFRDVCTVVYEQTGAGARLLALRDEFVGRTFDPPGQWWSEHPAAVGGRDRAGGGSWCVSDLRAGATALVVNRFDRPTGTPTRGLLPLAALAHGEGWSDDLDVTSMASFTLLLVRMSGAVAWSWDGVDLRRDELGSGLHLVTPRGVDADDARTRRFAPQFADGDWLGVVGRTAPSDAEDALVVRRTIAERTYATVFGQLIEAVPGEVRLRHTRTPWLAETWVEQVWRAT
jgi:hypothetical protein